MALKVPVSAVDTCVSTPLLVRDSSHHIRHHGLVHFLLDGDKLHSYAMQAKLFRRGRYGNPGHRFQMENISKLQDLFQSIHWGIFQFLLD